MVLRGILLGSVLTLALAGCTSDTAPEAPAAATAPPPEATAPAPEAVAPAPGPPAAVAPDALATGVRVADGFLARVPDPASLVPLPPAPQPSNTWSRGVFFEGLLDLARETRHQGHLGYARAWAEANGWGLDGGPTTRFADSHVAGIAYFDLWDLDGRADDRRIAAIEASLGELARSPRFDDWYWVDAIHMAMPVLARFAVLRSDARLHDAMAALYGTTRARLFDEARGLWFRDAKFLPPYAEPNGAPCFWSRGNGWAMSGIARALDALPEGTPHRARLEGDLRRMADAAVRTRRADGFWNVSLEDPSHFGGPEMTGTSLFVHALALGVRRGVLPREPYGRVARESFDAMAAAVRADATLAWVQGTATQPSDRQPVRRDTVPNVDDFAVGCFLLASAEVARLARAPL